MRARSIAIVNAKGDPEQIIPTYISKTMPKWFGIIFLLTLLAAAMSTVSSQVHTAGTALGRDIFQHSADAGSSIPLVKAGMILNTLVAVVISWQSTSAMVIARATAIFFGMCAAAFLPSYIGGLYFKKMSRAAAIASIVSGAVVYAVWTLFIKEQDAAAIGLVRLFTGGANTIVSKPNWPVVDALIVALPVSVIVAIVVSQFTKPCPEDHLRKCFGNEAA